VIDAWIIEIDRLLHAAQAKRVSEEAVVLPRIRCHRGHVMQSVDILDHVDAFQWALVFAC